MQMTLDLNGDGGRHKAQLERERKGGGERWRGRVGELSVWRGGGGRLLNANLRKPNVRTDWNTKPETGGPVSESNNRPAAQARDAFCREQSRSEISHTIYHAMKTVN